MTGPTIMLHSQIDHITVTATSLAAGVDYVSRMLGVAPQIGGEHPRMGTHNCLLKLGDTLFLEVIAVNPEAPRPGRPRWFALDAMSPQQLPRLAMWVARTSDIHTAVRESPLAVGKVEPMSRGPLNWLISIPEDGSLPLDGVAPTLIQWHTDDHPALHMQEMGCSLARLQGFHPAAAQIERMLGDIGFEGAFSVGPLDSGRQPYLVAPHRNELPMAVFPMSMGGRRNISSKGGNARKAGKYESRIACGLNIKNKQGSVK
jgi:hypothetical protein